MISSDKSTPFPFEVNFPVAAIPYVPGAYLLNLFDVSDLMNMSVIIRTAGIIACLLALFSCHSLLKHAPYRERLALCLFLSLGLFILPHPIYDFANRSHLFICSWLPHLLISIRSLNGHFSTPSIRAQIIFAILAGAGASLKPHFIILFFAQQILLALCSKQPLKKLLDAPALAGSATIFIILALSYWLYPDYFIFILPNALKTYGAYNLPFTNTWPLTLGGGLVFLMIGLWSWRYRQTLGHNKLLFINGMTATSLALSLVSQGWQYDYYPVFILGCVFPLIFQLDRRPAVSSRHLIFWPLFACLISLQTSLIFKQLLRPNTASCYPTASPAMQNKLMAHGKSRDSLLISVALYWPMKLVFTHNHLQWPASRFAHLWMISALYSDENHAEWKNDYEVSENLRPFRDWVFQTLYDDITTHRPELIVVDNSYNLFWKQLRHFRFEEAFRKINEGRTNPLRDYDKVDSFDYCIPPDVVNVCAFDFYVRRQDGEAD